MIEVVVEIDNRPLSRWGCDGVVLATPTGSTAYNFSAGGPIVWPGVEALLVVPISAHALFARPLVVAPDSLLAVEVIARTDGAGVLWCDGRRAVDLPPGARIEVRRADRPVRLARLHEAPFTDRLVAKFDLPVEGWRGSAERRRRADGRRGQGEPDARGDPDRPARRHRVLDARLGPGLTVITGETGAGKTMVVTALGLLLGGRADSGMVRTGAGPARVEGVVDATRAGRVRGRGRRGRRRGRGRPGGAGPQRLGRGPVAGLGRRRVGARCPGWPRSPSRWWPCTASPTSTGCCASAPSARRWTGSAASRCSRWSRPTPRCTPGSRPPSASSTRSWPAPASGPGRPTCSGSGSARSRRSTPSPARTPSWRPTRRGWATPTRCAPPPSRRARRCPARPATPTRWAPTSAARTLLEGVREHDPEAGALADRLAEITYLLSDLAADVASYAAAVDADPARLAAVSERRAALTALTRKYGETVEEVLAWAETSAARLLDLDGTDERIEALRAEQRLAPGRAGRGRRRRCRAPAAEAAARLSERGHRRAVAAGDARRPARDRGHPARGRGAGGDPPPSGSPLRVGSGGCGTRRAGSTRSSSCSPPTPAPSRGRCTRAPPAASCPG